MNEERQDPDLDILRDEWDAPPASPGFDARVISAYRGRFERLWLARWGWLLAAAFVAGTAAFALIVYTARPASRFRPVQSPHFYIVSAGEHP
jgi:hypothetical protein